MAALTVLAKSAPPGSVERATNSGGYRYLLKPPAPDGAHGTRGPASTAGGFASSRAPPRRAPRRDPWKTNNERRRPIAARRPQHVAEAKKGPRKWKFGCCAHPCGTGYDPESGEWGAKICSVTGKPCALKTEWEKVPDYAGTHNPRADDCPFVLKTDVLDSLSAMFTKYD